MKAKHIIFELAIAAALVTAGCASAPEPEETAAPAPVTETAPEPAEAAAETPAPQATLSVAPKSFSPDGDGKNDAVTFTVALPDPAAAGSWSLVVTDAGGAVAKEFSGKDLAGGTVSWDGAYASGDKADSATKFTARLAPPAGSDAKAAEASFSTDVLVVRERAKSRIMVPSIVFKAYTADYEDVSARDRASNQKALETVARILKTRQGTRISIEGFAVAEHWGDPARLAKENAEELIPLSAARAAKVKEALVALGCDPAAITTVGLGSTNPRVSNSDIQNRWLNRRAEFILLQ